jgi:hypothetical protein
MSHCQPGNTMLYKNVLCIHLEHKSLRIAIHPKVGKWIVLEFIEHIKKKWPSIEAHIIELDQGASA